MTMRKELMRNDDLFKVCVCDLRGVSVSVSVLVCMCVCECV
jgi:hypothetical protein